MTRGDAGEEARCEPVAIVRQLAARLHQLSPFLDPGIDEFADAPELLLRVDRADVGVLVERVAHAQGLEPVAQPPYDLVVDRFLDEQARAGATDVALVEVDRIDDALHRIFDGRVVHDDVGRLAAEL